MANAVKHNRDRDNDNVATDSLDTQAVLEDYIKTYGAEKVAQIAQTNTARPSSTISNPSSYSKSNHAQRPTMTKPRRTRDEDLFPPLTQSEEDRIRNSRPADDLSENKPLDMEAYRAHKARQAAERKRAREEANKPKVSWFKPSQLLVMAAQWEQEAKEKNKKEKEGQEKREAEERARQASQEKREKEEQLQAEEAKRAEEQRQAETQPSAYSGETTQSNGGRSYDKYIASGSQPKTTADPLQSSPKLGASSPALEPASVATTVPGSRGSRLLDTPATNKTTSTTQDGSGCVDFGSIARLRNMHSQKQHPSPAHQMPETPVSENNNPFRQSKSQLLGSSQLFGATQFSSAAKAFASPTSSRPSPSDFMHHTVSPNLAVSSPLRARGLRSSPAKHVPSSPAALPDAPPPRATQRRLASPGPGALDDDMVIPESPQTQKPRKKKATQGPLASYEPMDKSQERWSSPILGSDPPGPPNDEDTDTSMVRRRKAKLKKKAALEQLTEIQLSRAAKSDDVEIPSSTKSRGGKAKPATQDPAHEDEEAAAIPNTVEESQRERVESAPAHAIDESSQSGPGEEPAPKSDANSKVPRSTQRMTPRPRSQVQEKHRPDTSGAGVVPNTSQVHNTCEEESAQDPPSSSQLPALPPPPSNNVLSSSPPVFERRGRKKRVSTSGDQVAKIPISSTVRTTKAKMTSSAVDAAVQTTSDLSNLASTPVMPSSGRPARDPSTSFTRPDLGSSSPAPVNNLRRDAAGRLPKSPKAGSTESIRQSARAQRRLSSSADELPVSGVTIPTLDHNVRMSRSSLLKPSATSSMAAPAPRGPKMFEGMAFAISFQSKRTGESADQYSVRMETAANIEKRIKQAGGRILTNGFDELFEPIPVQPASVSSNDKSHSSSLSDGPTDLLPNNVGSSTGFTSLIADGHSRKVKYMQALALGLPILAPRWVLTCLSSGSIVDWSPYLLAAGQSAFLGDAIMSRNLQPYDARTAKLVETVAKRGRWLGGSRILLVMSTGSSKKGNRGQKEKEKQEEGKKMAYVFLAMVLGAELRRVNSLDEAKRELDKAEKEAEDGKGKPYDWVYVDGKAGVSDLFTNPAAVVGESDAGSASAGGAGKNTKSKKRKRQSVGYVYEPTEAEKQPPSKKIRTLSDELVIQSLILGRMIDEEEFGST